MSVPAIDRLKDWADLQPEIADLVDEVSDEIHCLLMENCKLREQIRMMRRWTGAA